MGIFSSIMARQKPADIRALIELAQRTVQGKFGIALELEIELVGEW